MSTLQFTGEHRTAPSSRRARRVLGERPGATLAGLGVVALLIVWAAHDGGYDADTWGWGALLLLAANVAGLASGGWRQIAGSPQLRFATLALAGYVAFSYLSILWAGSPGDAWSGSNRALLYLELFVLMAGLPWSAGAARAALVAYALGIGVLAFIALIGLAGGNHLASLLVDGRLGFPTGYYNASAALFFGAALVSIALAASRRLPGLLRGVLIAAACAELQLTLVAQSRGWLFTLPIVLAVSWLVARDRLRLIAAAVLPTIGALAPAHRMLAVYDSQSPAELAHAAHQAGRTGLAICFGCFFLGTILCWGDGLVRRAPSRRTVRWIGLATATVVLAGAVGGAFAATHGDPAGFVSRQWRGFSHPPTAAGSGSHFATVGSGRYDFWRVSLDAFTAHPLGGLGQDNFADFYLPRRHTDEEPSWTHSLEMRLLAHTGLVGGLLFAAWLVLAVAAAVRTRRRGDPERAALAAIGLLPLVVWAIHGSVDWFWEMPALSGPAIAFLAMAAALGRPEPAVITATPRPAPRPLRLLAGVAATGLLLAATLALAFPYLSVRYTSRASDEQFRNPLAALADLQTAADLEPLDAGPPRLAGAIALRNGLPNVAAARFATATSREPGGWFGWLGAGLAASTLGEPAEAERDLARALAINRRQLAVRTALARVGGAHPLTPAEAFRLLVVAH